MPTAGEIVLNWDFELGVSTCFPQCGDLDGIVDEYFEEIYSECVYVLGIVPLDDEAKARVFAVCEVADVACSGVSSGPVCPGAASRRLRSAQGPRSDQEGTALAASARLGRCLMMSAR